MYLMLTSTLQGPLWRRSTSNVRICKHWLSGSERHEFSSVLDKHSSTIAYVIRKTAYLDVVLFQFLEYFIEVRKTLASNVATRGALKWFQLFGNEYGLGFMNIWWDDGYFIVLHSCCIVWTRFVSSVRDQYSVWKLRLFLQYDWGLRFMVCISKEFAGEILLSEFTIEKSHWVY